MAYAAAVYVSGALSCIQAPVAAQALPAVPAGSVLEPGQAPKASPDVPAPVFPPVMSPAQAAAAAPAPAPGLPTSFASLGQDSAPGHPGRHVSAVIIAAPVAAVGGSLLLLAAITAVAACLLRARKARQTAPEPMQSSLALTPQASTASLSAEASNTGPGWQAVFSAAAMALPELEMSIRRAHLHALSSLACCVLVSSPHERALHDVRSPCGMHNACCSSERLLTQHGLQDAPTAGSR